MIFSNPSEYAIRALSELVLMTQEAADHPGRRAGYVMLDNLIERSTLPREVLAKIFRQLVEAGILDSAQGAPAAGFSPRPRPPQKVSHSSTSSKPPTADTASIAASSASPGATTPQPCPQHDLFKPVRQKLQSYLSTTTLARAPPPASRKRNTSAANTPNPKPPPPRANRSPRSPEFTLCAAFPP